MDGTVDLGIRLRDGLYNRQLLTGPVRSALGRRLTELSLAPHRLAMGMHLVEMFLDTWPLGAMIDDARERWVEGPDGPSLAVLARAAHVVAAALGWPTTIDRRWPMPDEEWMRDQVGKRTVEVRSRGPRDGAPAVAVALEAPWTGDDLLPLPAVLSLPGDELPERLHALLARIDAGEGAAVYFDTPITWNAASREALETLHARVPGQQTFERYGLAGLLAPDAPTFEELLATAPPGVMGDRLQPTCDTVVIPGLDEQGQVRAVGCMLWDSPYRPLAVVAGAAEVVRQFQGGQPIEAVARVLEVEDDTIVEVARQLVAAGALTAA